LEEEGEEPKLVERNRDRVFAAIVYLLHVSVKSR
jgi:hypothetical protein